MKIIGVVGIRQSGKTTTVEVLIKELKKRGFTVGTVKTIHCPLFEIEENEKSNTKRHKEAGADVVCASAKGETAFIYGEGLGQNRIFEKMAVDYLILEGDYQADVPRIICAHEEVEIPPRITEQTFLVSGRIADRQEQACGYPAMSAVKDPTALVEKVLECAHDVLLPVKLLPIPKEAITFCRHACKKVCEQAKKEDGAEPGDNGAGADRVPETEKPALRHIFLTGEKQVGKSTILEKVLKELGIGCRGFRTYPFELNGERRGFYMHAFGAVPEGYVNDVLISARTKQAGSVPVTEAFDTFGAQVLTKAAEDPDCSLILIDELGRLEQNAMHFQKAALDCLDSDKLVLGVLQKTESTFLDRIHARNDVEVFVINEENRDYMAERLLAIVKGRLRPETKATV